MESLNIRKLMPNPMQGYRRITIDEMCDLGVENLISAIVKLAIKDYEERLMTLLKRGKELDIAILIIEKENPDELQFLNSEHFVALTAGLIDPKVLLEITQRNCLKEYQDWLYKKEPQKVQHLHHAHTIKETRKDA